MLHAVQAPLLKSAVVAGAALAITAVVSPLRGDAMVEQRLELHAPRCPSAIYLTAWEHGDITIKVPEGEAVKPLTLTKRGRFFGCDWVATETLIPDGPNRYFYSYEEQKGECDPDAPPSIDTPRIGYVLVVDED